MRFVKTRTFGPVQAVEMGYSPIGRPMMSVYFYLLDGLLIDTGQRHMRREALGAVGEAPIRQILLTHHHEDHCGNAAAFCKRTGATVWGEARCAAKLQRGYRIKPYQHLIWGAAAPVTVKPLTATISSGAYELAPVKTPGHSQDHLVYHERNYGWLFSGDLFIGEKIKFFRADEDLADQIASLQKVLALEFDALFCAHHPCPQNGKRHLARKLEFLVAFRDSVQDLHQQGLSVREIIRRLDPGSDRWVRWFTMGNASFANMVRSALKSVVAMRQEHP